MGIFHLGPNTSLEAVNRFPLRPRAFSSRFQDLLAMPMQTQLDLRFATLQIQTLWKETVSLTEGGYIPKFDLPD